MLSRGRFTDIEKLDWNAEFDDYINADTVLFETSQDDIPLSVMISSRIRHFKNLSGEYIELTNAQLDSESHYIHWKTKEPLIPVYEP